jgi:hypothetical protein
MDSKLHPIGEFVVYLPCITDKNRNTDDRIERINTDLPKRLDLKNDKARSLNQIASAYLTKVCTVVRLSPRNDEVSGVR